MPGDDAAPQRARVAHRPAASLDGLHHVQHVRQVVLRRTLDVVLEVVFLRRSLGQYLPVFHVDPRVVVRHRCLLLAGMQEVGLDLPQPGAELVDRRLAIPGGHLGPLLDGRDQRLLSPPHVDEALDVLHEVLLDVGRVHRDDIDCQVLQNLAHVPVVELLPVYVISVVRLVKLRQCRVDAQSLLSGPSAAVLRLLARDLHHRGHELAVDLRQCGALVVAMDQEELGQLKRVG